MKRLVLCLLLLSLPLSARAGPEDGAAHLLAGARHFREGRFAQALVEFRVAERSGAGGEAMWYVAACLVKLGRVEEALEVFDRAQATAPEAVRAGERAQAGPDPRGRGRGARRAPGEDTED